MEIETYLYARDKYRNNCYKILTNLQGKYPLDKFFMGKIKNNNPYMSNQTGYHRCKNQLS